MSDPHAPTPAAAPTPPVIATGAHAPVAPTPPTPAAHTSGDTSEPKGKGKNMMQTVRDLVIICILVGVIIVVFMGPNRFYAARENIANGILGATSSHPSADAIVMIVAIALIIYMVFKPQPKVIIQKTEEKNKDKGHGGGH